MNKKQSLRRVISVCLVLAMVFGTLGISGWGADEAYAAFEDDVNNAISSTLSEYYGTTKNHMLEDWQELMAVAAAGEDLEDYIMPELDGQGAGEVIGELIEGHIEAAGNAAATLAEGGQLKHEFTTFADAMNIVAVEAYNRSVDVSNKVTYSTDAAIAQLLSHRCTFNGIENQFAAEDYFDPGTFKAEPDSAGMAMLALSLFAGDTDVDVAIETAINQIKNAQTEEGTFIGAWAGGIPDSNTTANVVWGVMAADADTQGSDPPGEAVGEPAGTSLVDGLLSFSVDGGGFGYTDSNAVNAYATKQVLVALADISSEKSYLKTLTASPVSYIGTKAQVVDENGNYFEKTMTMGTDKSLEKAIERALNTDIDTADYKIYVNGTLEENPEGRNLVDADKVLAVYKDFNKAAYFKASSTDTLGVATCVVPSGETKELIFVQKDFATNDETVLANKILTATNANTGNGGQTDADGKITIIPIESGIECTITAPYSVTDWNTYVTTYQIATDVAILPAKITMQTGSPTTATNVNVRVEGPTGNIINKTLTVARNDGSRLTVYDAVTKALDLESIPYTASNKYISGFNGISTATNGDNGGWMYSFMKPEYLNGTKFANEMGQEFISSGDEIVVYYTNASFTTAFAEVSTTLNTNGTVSIQVQGYLTDPETWAKALSPISDVTVSWGYTSGGAMTYTTTTGITGIVTIPKAYATTGNHSLQISKMTDGLPDIVRLAPDYTVGISSGGASENTGGGEVVVEKAYISVKGPNGMLLSRTGFDWYRGMTAMDILQSSGLTLKLGNSGTYVEEIEGIGEFDLGKNAGWLYSVNGKTPSTTAAKEYDLEAGDSVIWYYSLDYTKDSSSKGWSGTTVETAEEVKNVATGTAEVSATIGSNGTASAKVDAKTVTTAISDAEATAKKTGDASTAVVIKVEADKAATAVETSIPKASVTELKNKIGAVTVDTPLADITLDKETLETIASQAPADVKISVTTVDKASLTNVAEETKAEIADRPVYDFTVTSGDKTISEFGGKVSVSVPYTPAEGEDAAAIVIYYLNDKGGLEVVKDCKYDPATKTVKFSTNHFSTYVVGYNPVSFTDTKNHWAKESIEYLAVRNLVDGMSESEFAPNNQITRAQFVQLLANLSGADLSTYSKLPFDDVTATAWYAAAADWAYETGVVTGTTNKDGRTYFNPNANITRQDMAVMLARYAEKIEKYTITGTNKAIVFSDDASIAAYAKESVSKMQQAGIINGKTATTFVPTDNATRAEASKMLAAFIQML